MSTSDIAHLLLALGVLLLVAHAFAAVFARLRLPRVVGEIVGGLLVGPTLLGAAAPHVQAWVFPASGTTATVLAAVYQLGLLLLMFCSGIEIRAAFDRTVGRTVLSVFVVGTLVPFVAGLGLLKAIHQRALWGPNGNPTSFLLVFAIAMAVTSIPVISRIMYDLGILRTRFARVVLGVAVIEDIALYVVLAVALGIVEGAHGGLFGLPGALGLHADTAGDMAYHSFATVTVLLAFLVFGPRLYRAASRFRYNVVRNRSVIAYQLVFMLSACIACAFVGIQPFFGAFVAGIVVGATEETGDAAVEAIQGFSFAFFIPVYFAGVGLQLDLVHRFAPLFFLGYFVFACAVKATSVYVGARVAGESRFSSRNLAVAMNARGGPGIVLASLAYEAGIVNQRFYAVLVLVAVLTSLLAGAWLDRVPRERLLEPAEALASRR